MRAQLIAGLFVMVLAAAPAGAQRTAASPGAPVIVTAGEGIVKLAPDRAWIAISAESRARGPREAQRATADAMAAVTARIRSAGVPADALRTSAYDLQPEFDFASGKQTLRGYVARNTVEVRVDDLARVGEIIDATVGAGATSVGGIRFDLKDRAAAEREALTRAVADARARAEAAAAGAAVTIDRILRIEEQRVPEHDPRPVMMMRATADAQAQTPISPGELEIRATVTMTLAIR